MSSPLGDYIKPILILTGTLIVTFLVARSMFRHDPREPPLAPSSIPLIGHAVGLSRSSFNYYVELSKQITAPIFTVSLPGQKMYVVTKPELIQQVQKQHRTLAFPPIEAKFATVVGGHGLSMETYAAMRAALQPGPALDEMNRTMLAEINKSLYILAPVKDKKEIGLFEWLRDNLTLATTRAVYGPRSPFDEKEICDAFWDFEAGLMQILIAFLPSTMARRPINARTKVVRAFQKYYSEGGIDEASAYAWYRHEVEVKNEFPAEDMARSSVGGTIALLVNTVPSVFWMLLHLHACPGLLGQVRDEIDACTLDDGTVKTIDMASLKEQCPLLLSTYREVLRHRAMGASVREVMEDTQLDGFHLKKGAMLQMPSRIIHADESLWGSSEFNPRRFLESEKDARPRDVCFRAFGGGKTLCPGRHFATNEILAVVALWIARFDMLPVGGEWKEPTTAKTNVAAAVMGPDEDVQVEIATRKGLEHVTWAVKLEASDKTFAIVAEDFGDFGSKEVA
ncbi:hypothetical protein E8E14_003752 [Neopestalotiopsis sp. 37M]|nr:hypothetical protein E8E14_003752 [Neopestalotiopsis sp. 37M]